VLKAGVAKLDITPPIGVGMAGFAGRVFPALAVHDPLWARALVLDDGRQRLGMVALDLIGIQEEAVAQARSRVAAMDGIAPEALLFAGSHTHSGPSFWGDFTDQERAYWEGLPARLAQVVSDAVAALAPARLGTSHGWTAVGINRREVTPEGNVILGRNHFGRFDPEVRLLRVDHADGRPMAGVMNYACHAVCLMADNYLLSADYPGFARHLFEREKPGAMGLFFNGACGNINPREAAVGHGLVSGGGFGVAQHAGFAVARETLRVWDKAAPEDDLPLRVKSRRIAIPTNRARALKAAEAAVESAERAAGHPYEERNPYLTWYSPPDPEGARRRVARLKEQGESPVECEIQALAVGPTAFMAWPGEIFCDLGMMVKEDSPYRPTCIIGYANGSIGYVPVPETYKEGGYEAGTAAHLADNAGLVLVDESLKLLRELHA
jgi:neutral ceramidase